MSIKSKNLPYEKPVKIYWNIVAGPGNLDPINLYDVILDDYDFRIRKMDPKTREFIKWC